MKSLLARGHHVAAASLTGAVLERALRKLCEVRGIAQTKAGAYSTRVQERITVLAGIRDNADQGKPEAVRRDDVEGMARWVRAFAADSLG